MRKPSKTEIDQGYEEMIRGFEAISRIPSKTKRDYHLSQCAKYWGLSKSEAGRFYRNWQVERSQGGEA